VVISHAPPPSPSVPTVPADVPRTGPNLVTAGEQPPVMPVEATQHTQQGAVAFARFFIRTIDWGFATTSGAYMRHYFEPSCIECRSHADGLDNTRKAGEHYLGGRFQITRAAIAPDGGSQAERSVIVAFDLTSATVLDKHNRPKSSDVAHQGVQRQIWLRWAGGSWTVVEMKPVS
jgi:hypothetical protein